MAEFGRATLSTRLHYLTAAGNSASQNSSDILRKFGLRTSAIDGKAYMSFFQIRGLALCEFDSIRQSLTVKPLFFFLFPKVWLIINQKDEQIRSNKSYLAKNFIVHPLMFNRSWVNPRKLNLPLKEPLKPEWAAVEISKVQTRLSRRIIIRVGRSDTWIRYTSVESSLCFHEQLLNSISRVFQANCCQFSQNRIRYRFKIKPTEPDAKAFIHCRKTQPLTEPQVWPL